MNKALVSVAIVLFALFAGTPRPASAHDLVPEALNAYLGQHPNATPEEIESFIQNASPATATQLQTTADPIKNTLHFIELGIRHILGGLDHILFVLSLLLVFVSIKDTLKLISAFTLAHSATLILAGTGALVLSARIVEPIIALSIAYVAISSVFFKRHMLIAKSKLPMVFFFGLFHGLGFAGLLQEIKIPDGQLVGSLLAFNVGVELGQILIISSLLPLIYFFRSKPWYEEAIQITALAIGVVGIIWSIQRIFFS